MYGALTLAGAVALTGYERVECWRLSAAAMIRGRKRDFGEPIVPCTMHSAANLGL